MPLVQSCRSERSQPISGGVKRSMASARGSNERTALIVGAGIGGLAAGVALRHVGWNVRIFERAASPRELGFALLLAPNAISALRRLGLADRVIAPEEQGSRAGRSAVRTAGFCVDLTRLECCRFCRSRRWSSCVPYCMERCSTLLAPRQWRSAMPRSVLNTASDKSP
jgi:FAD binding domain